jgi:hypothetical protein
MRDPHNEHFFVVNLINDEVLIEPQDANAVPE